MLINILDIDFSSYPVFHRHIQKIHESGINPDILPSTRKHWRISQNVKPTLYEDSA